MINILHVLPDLDSGGPENRRLQLARTFPRSEFRQVVACFNSRPSVVREFESHGVRVHKLPGKGRIINLRAVQEMSALVNRYDIGIVHGAVFEGVNLAVMTGLATDGTTVVIEETGDPVIRSWRGHLLMRVFSALADHAVAVSPYVEQYLTNEIGSRAPVSLIPNGVSISPCNGCGESIRKELGISPESTVIGSIGRLNDSHKRFSDIIHAVQRIRTHRDVHGIIVGDGPDHQMLLRLASKLGLSGHIHFVGYQGDVAPFLDLMDIFVLASMQESFGLVLAEAMIVETPVIATKVGGVPYVVGSGGARLIAPFRPDQIAREIDWICSNPAETATMVAKAKRWAETMFTEAAYVGRVETFYRTIAAATD